MVLILSALIRHIFAHVQRQDLDFYRFFWMLARKIGTCCFSLFIFAVHDVLNFLVICTVHPHQSNHNYCYLDYFVLELAYSYIAGIYKQYSLDVDSKLKR